MLLTPTEPEVSSRPGRRGATSSRLPSASQVRHSRPFELAVHFFFTALVIAAGIVLQCLWWEWCGLIACIGFVLTAELFNSAIETLFRGLDENTRERSCRRRHWSRCGPDGKHHASIIGSIILLHRLAVLLNFSWPF